MKRGTASSTLYSGRRTNCCALHKRYSTRPSIPETTSTASSPSNVLSACEEIVSLPIPETLDSDYCPHTPSSVRAREDELRRRLDVAIEMERFMDATRHELEMMLRSSSSVNETRQSRPSFQANLDRASSSRARTIYVNALQDGPDDGSEDPFWASLSAQTRIGGTEEEAFSPTAASIPPSRATLSLRAALASSSSSSTRPSIPSPDDAPLISTTTPRLGHKRRSSAYASLMSVRRCASEEILDSPPRPVLPVASTSSSSSPFSRSSRQRFSSPPDTPSPLSHFVPPILEDNEESAPETTTTPSRCGIRPSRSMSPLSRPTPPPPALAPSKTTTTMTTTTTIISGPTWLPPRVRLREAGEASARERLPASLAL
jgi:hypothetical protein